MKPFFFFLLLTLACAHKDERVPVLEARDRVVAPTGAPTDERPFLANDPPLVASGQKRLDFQSGEPTIAVRLMEGREEIFFSSTGRMRVNLPGEIEKSVDSPGKNLWSVRLLKSTPAQVTTWIQVSEFPFSDRKGLEESLRVWRQRGVALRVETIGTVYGIAGKVIDNRKKLLLLTQPFSAEDASRKQAELFQAFGERSSLFEQLQTPPRGILELRDAQGVSVGLGQDRIWAQATEDGAIEVNQVEFGVGYDFHGFEDRRFRGRLEFTVDRQGKLAVVNHLRMEPLLKGLVPAEIFPRAHPEALKAQAVTARGEVLAKIGLKHLADPYLLCAEQHCAVYKGLIGESDSTNAAVEATRGEGLFSQNGRLVDSVYSAVCGGHSEDNDIVWDGPKNPNLRGRPDTLPEKQLTAGPAQLSSFLAAEQPVACRTSSFAQPTKFRWERRFTAAEVNALTASFKIGEIEALTPSDRGVSGRARILTLSGTQGTAEIRGELNIRKLFKMLPSSMFLVEPERAANGQLSHWRFRGGGWGHGVGMCQTGAIGRAEAGQTYREILEHYYNGAQVAPLY